MKARWLKTNQSRKNTDPIEACNCLKCFCDCAACNCDCAKCNCDCLN